MCQLEHSLVFVCLLVSRALKILSCELLPNPTLRLVKCIIINAMTYDTVKSIGNYHDILSGEKKQVEQYR